MGPINLIRRALRWYRNQNGLVDCVTETGCSYRTASEVGGERSIGSNAPVRRRDENISHEFYLNGTVEHSVGNGGIEINEWRIVVGSQRGGACSWRGDNVGGGLAHNLSSQVMAAIVVSPQLRELYSTPLGLVWQVFNRPLR